MADPGRGCSGCPASARALRAASPRAQGARARCRSHWRACALTLTPHAAGRRRLLPSVHQRRRRRRACAVVRATCLADSRPPLLLLLLLTRRRSPGVPCVRSKPQHRTSRCGRCVALPARMQTVLKTRNCVRSTSTLATPRPLQSWQSARTRSSACRRCVRWRAFGCGAAALSWRRCTR